MTDNINLLPDEGAKQDDKIFLGKAPVKKRGKKIFSYLFIFIAIILAFFSLNIKKSEQSESFWFFRLPIISQLKRLAESADNQLKGEDRGRVNILLLNKD